MSEENKNLNPSEDQPVENPAEQTENQAEATETPAEEVEETPAEEIAEAPVEESEEAPAEEVAEAPKAEEKPETPKKKTSPITQQVPGEFDWDSIGKKQEAYSAAERQRMEILYDETLKSIGEGEVIDGTVVSMNNREVVVNIGFKSDGVIPAAEVRYNQDLKIGDAIEVYVESQEDTSGQLVLSHKKGRTLRSWERSNAAIDNYEIIKGFV